MTKWGASFAAQGQLPSRTAAQSRRCGDAIDSGYLPCRMAVPGQMLVTITGQVAVTGVNQHKWLLRRIIRGTTWLRPAPLLCDCGVHLYP
jgi:hypothetical protein